MSATSSGLTKKLSNLSASLVRTDGSSTISSIMISETWIPDGPSERARDLARLRWAALAEANAAVLAPPRREAVAPTKIDVAARAPLHRGDDAARGGEGAKCVDPPRRLEIFEGHLLGGAQNPLARIVNKDVNGSEVRLIDPKVRSTAARSPTSQA